MASVQAHAVVERVLALLGPLVTRVVDPSVGLEKHGWAKILLGVPPVGWAGCTAARAQNALVETVELTSVGNGLAILLALHYCVSIDQIQEAKECILTSGGAVSR